MQVTTLPGERRTPNLLKVSFVNLHSTFILQYHEKFTGYLRDIYA
jgi:hypothetical protein